VYAAAPTLTQAQAQALSALGHHPHVNGLVSTVPTMALSPTMGGVALTHPATSMQKLLSLPPPKVRFSFLSFLASPRDFRFVGVALFFVHLRILIIVSHISKARV
jgi:hypothetical protein